MDYRQAYESWLSSPAFDEATKQELRSLAGNDKEIEERFYKNLEFGTGGLRGILGAGTNRMNIYTVRKATQGFANFILKQGPEGRNMGVCIAHDSRRMSPEFTKEAALVLNGNGIKTYVFDSLRPTPTLSFAVRQLGCIAGIVITASHNPPEYNGYKAYWADGGQIPYPKDEAIIDEVNEVTDFASIKIADYNNAVKSGLFNILGSKLDNEYIKCVTAQALNRDIVKKLSGDFTIVYTPLHGAGNIPVRRALSEIGFKHVHTVPEQALPDSNFSTVGYPNPEDPKAFALAIKLAKDVSADIIVGTDPDADRVGALAKDSNGDYVILTGNMTGVLLCDYMLSHQKAKGILPKNAAVITTIVSTNMTRKIAEYYNVDYFEVLTGFKYFGDKIKRFEQDKSHSYVFGFEESYGCLCGSYARDKDGISASMLICEMAAWYKSRGMTLYDGLMELYSKFGYFRESTENITLKGIDGLEKIMAIMKGLRNNPPKAVGEINVRVFRDYKEKTFTNLETGAVSASNLPVSDVLYFELADESWFCIRPSGTEPKIKVYFGVEGTSYDDANRRLSELTQNAMAVVQNIR